MPKCPWETEPKQEKKVISLRTPETEAKYQAFKKTKEADGCCFCREVEKFEKEEDTAVICTWEHWGLMWNDFPYDAVYDTHHLLFPLRHVDYEDLTLKEIEEYRQIVKNLDYHQSVENFGERQSQKGHWHIHFCNFGG